MTNVILCGGSGTRLWPISRELFPKQFYKFKDNLSLFQQTVLRNKDLCDDFLIVTNHEQYFLALDQLEEIKIKNFRFIVEPAPRNTAAAIALACFDAKSHNSGFVFITPSDHIIQNDGNYKNIIKLAKDLAEDNSLILFGIKPAHPETGYGYIEANTAEENILKDAPYYSVNSFKEKPDRDTALMYLSKNNYFWNSGMFLFNPEVLLNELSLYCPSLYESAENAYNNAKKDLTSVRIKLEDMLNIEENSIDYALLEKTSSTKVIPSDIKWSDMGSFDSLYAELEKDSDNNAKLNSSDFMSSFINVNSKKNLILSSGRTIAVVDIEDLIIVDTDDALLLSKRGSSQNVKKVVEKLKELNSELHFQHLTVHRPWGSYTILLDSPAYKIKKILVKPKAKLSLQKHYHRSEHWIVTSGTALVTVDDKKILLKSNESTYIPIGSLHRLENPGLIPLVLIEAQVGEYLKEDDIVRIEDSYNRID